VQLVRAQAFGAARHHLVDQLWVDVGLAEDRRQVLHRGQDHRGALAGQHLTKPSIHLPEVAQDPLRLPLAWMPVAVVDATCADPAAVGDIQLQLLLDLLALEGIPNP
jgi:hypothetical protein